MPPETRNINTSPLLHAGEEIFYFGHILTVNTHGFINHRFSIRRAAVLNIIKVIFADDKHDAAKNVSPILFLLILFVFIFIFITLNFSNNFTKKFFNVDSVRDYSSGALHYFADRFINLSEHFWINKDKSILLLGFSKFVCHFCRRKVTHKTSSITDLV